MLCWRYTVHCCKCISRYCKGNCIVPQQSNSLTVYQQNNVSNSVSVCMWTGMKLWKPETIKSQRKQRRESHTKLSWTVLHPEGLIFPGVQWLLVNRATWQQQRYIFARATQQQKKNLFWSIVASLRRIQTNNRS